MTLIISNKKMKDIIKIVKSFKESDLLIKCIGANKSKRVKRTGKKINWHAISYLIY